MERKEVKACVVLTLSDPVIVPLQLCGEEN